MSKILITGGTIFVSKYIAEHFVHRGDDVFVLNRNTHPQVHGVNLIQADKNTVCEQLKHHHFDLVIAVNIYTEKEMKNLLDGLSDIQDFIFISSSAVYPETSPLPFRESLPVGHNAIWGDYGENKIKAENYLIQKVPEAYILRPPYFYGKYQNLYREGFVFDCAVQKMPFYIPKDGKMKLQFYNVRDLCRFIDTLMIQKPAQHIFNVGNKQLIDINEFVQICYDIVGTPLNPVYVDASHNQRSYFPFYDYEYYLDVSEQYRLLPDTVSIYDGFKEDFEWYIYHRDDVMSKKTYFEYIEKVLKK